MAPFTSEKLRLTSRQHRILQLVNQGKPLNELAYELGTSRDAAELLEDIAVRLNHRLNLNYQPEEQPPDKQNLNRYKREKFTIL